MPPPAPEALLDAVAHGRHGTGISAVNTLAADVSVLSRKQCSLLKISASHTCQGMYWSGTVSTTLASALRGVATACALAAEDFFNKLVRFCDWWIWPGGPWVYLTT